MRKLLFPKFERQRYYDLHYRFFENMAKAAGIEVERMSGLENYGASFGIRYRDRRILIDFYDFPELAEHAAEFDAVFKFHCALSPADGLPCDGLVDYPDNVFPFTPISFYDWNEYEALAKEIHYRAVGDLVLNNQVPAGGGRKRRLAARRILLNGCHRLDFAITEQEQFWRKASDCLVSVCVPGARPNILDRGQLQYMAFGACTISPKLDTLLPYYLDPVPGYSYVECKPDFSDVIEKIEWCRDNREAAKRIGKNAQIVFRESCTPKRAWAWIDECLKVLG